MYIHVLIVIHVYVYENHQQFALKRMTGSKDYLELATILLFLKDEYTYTIRSSFCGLYRRQATFCRQLNYPHKSLQSE